MKIENKIWKLHKDKCTLRVIAEKISNFNRDEWMSLHLVIEVLYKKGVRWTSSQIRTAIEHCYDPRYYYQESIKEIWKKAGFECKKLPLVPKRWGGITEWETDRKKLERIGSNDLSRREYNFFRS